MGRIPTISSTVGARSGRSQGGGPNTVATPDDFGANIGGALQQLGQQGIRASEVFTAIQAKKTDEEVSNKVAQSDYTPRELALRNSAPADGSGLYDNTRTDYGNWVEEQANGIKDDKAREEYKRRMYAQMPGVSARAAQTQFTMGADNSKQQTNFALDSLNNKISSDPFNYDQFINEGNAVIDSSTSVPGTLKEGMKLNWRQDAASARFNGMLERAKSVEDIDAISQELASRPTDQGGKSQDDFVGKDWAKEFNPEKYNQIVNQLGTARKAIITKADADARAAIDSIEARAGNQNVLLPQDELRAAQMLAKQSQNPATLARIARITRDQELYKELRAAPTSEIRGQINAANGNPGISYPGVPPRVSNAINSATDKFGVSASYLGSMVTQEYGGNFKRKASNADPSFAPVGKDLRGVRADVADAATVAGQLFGRPLVINSAFRSQARQDQIRNSGDPNRVSVAKESHHTDDGSGNGGDALDISIVGMDDGEQGRLVGALVDAGFTGIGQYGTHIHADMRTAVPNSFGEKDGKFWGGWTNLSPEVSKALVDRGFAANLSADQVRRASPVQMSDDVDYGRGTDMTKDDGRPTSTAVGVAQFTDGTFLGVIRSPGVADKLGISLEGKSDAELLELRKNPDIAIPAAAALAAQNKQQVEGAIGRTISDSELYMAHFLGSGGAVALLKGYDGQPDQSAAKLLPAAAAANKKVFYSNGRELSVREVYGRINARYSGQPTNVAYGDNQTRQRILDNKEKALKEDPMREARDSGSQHVSDLFSQDGTANFTQRGQEARSVADYYGIPVNDMKPFTGDDVTAIQKELENGSADKVLDLMTQINSMGGDVARAGLKQLDQTNQVYAFAGGLALDSGSNGTAADIIRGEKRLKENDNLKSAIGADPSQISDAFTKATGASLYQISPRERQSVQDAALAHYAETFVARGGGNGFNEDAFGRSVQAVLGARGNEKALDTVNGEPTLLPKGVTGGELETAFRKMTVDDWIKMSDQKMPPRYMDGNIVNPDELADEARMRSIGGGKYKIQLSDNSFAVTGRNLGGGRVEAYVFSPDEKTIDGIVSRPESPVASYDQNVPDDPPAGYQAPLANPLSNFDDAGRWIGPGNRQ